MARGEAQRSLDAVADAGRARAAEGKVVANFSLPKSEDSFRVSRKMATRLDVDRTKNRSFDRSEVIQPGTRFFDPNPDGKSEREIVQPRFQEYVNQAPGHIKAEWVNSDCGSFAETLSINGWPIGIIGINTAWLSKDDKDKNQLTPGIHLLEEALRKVKDSAVHIVLGHHPLHWLLQEQDSRLRALLGKYHAIYLHGHMHKAEGRREDGAGDSFLTIQAGAAFQARDDEIWRNGLLWGELDCGQGQLRLQPRVWNPDHLEWPIEHGRFPEKSRIEGKDWWGFSIQVASVRGIFQNDPAPQDDPNELLVDTGEFGDEIRLHVKALLDRPCMKPIVKVLCPESENTQEATKSLIPIGPKFHLHNAILQLQKACFEGLNHCAEHSRELLKTALDGTEELFGWFMLLMVSEEWVSEQYNLGSGSADGPVFAVVSVNRGATLELAAARLRKKQGRWSLRMSDENPPEPRAVGNLGRKKSPNTQGREDGIAQAAAKEQKKDIWQTFYPGSKPWEDKLKQKDWEDELKVLLEDEYHVHGRSYFIEFSGNNLVDPLLKEAFARELPLVGVFVIGDGKQEILRNQISEGRLVATIRNFLLMLDDKRKLL